ncbi:MAG: hypothetical protein RSC98_10575, partial [Clostridia bacterium]
RPIRKPGKMANVPFYRVFAMDGYRHEQMMVEDPCRARIENAAYNLNILCTLSLQLLKVESSYCTLHLST